MDYINVIETAVTVIAHDCTRNVMSSDFLDTESRMFLDGMSSGFLDVCGGGIAGLLFHCISVERSQISIPFVTARRSHSFAKN